MGTIKITEYLFGGYLRSIRTDGKFFVKGFDGFIDLVFLQSGIYELLWSAV
jgi:hypothetical protein